MPDVSRSDSQRSDASQRPRVSFNRDVHVKRIGNAGTPRVVGALAGDGEGHLLPLPVRRERPTRLSRRELAREAERVLQQADSVQCTSSPLPDIGHRAKYSTLPPLRSRRHPRRPRLPHGSPSSSPEPRPRRNLVASIFSSLDRSRIKKTPAERDAKTSLKKTNSTSLSDLLQTSSSSPERPSDTRTRGTKLARSASDSRKAPRSQALKYPDFASLDRTTARKSKDKFRSHADNSDRSPSPPPRRNRTHVLKKSHSDPESPSQLAIPDHVQADVGGKKFQLSPIIEASPHDDYFEEPLSEVRTQQDDDADMHSSQVTSRPPLTKGRTVDVMVKRLSQDANLSRAPPRRFNSPAGLVAPGEERQHNNNMPFSYTRPTQGTPTRGRTPPTAEGGQVIYAEVVVGGGGSAKQTVHTQIPAGKHQPTTTGRIKIESVSDEDEGLGLSMDGLRRGSADYLDADTRTLGKRGFDSFDRDYSPKVNGYRSQVREFISNEKDDNNLRSSSKVVSDVRMDYGSKGLGSSVFKKEYVVHESNSYDSGNYILDPPGRGRADGMDSWKKEALLETNRYENEFNRMREPDRKMQTTNNFSDSFSKSENFEKEYNFSSKFVKNDDDTNGFSYRSDRLKKDPLIEPHIINRSDLSSRRNRLESRIESHRKDRLLNTNIRPIEKRDILLESKVNENNSKYLLSDHKTSTDTGFNTRREFLNSQIDFENGRIRNDKKYESENLVRTNYYNESLTEIDSHGKKDLLADSGIEMDYRKDSSGAIVNKYNDTPHARSHSNDSPAKIAVNKWQSSNVTRVDLNGHLNERLTDEEDIDTHNYKPSTTKHSRYTKEMASDSFVSARLVKEQKETTEAIPTSTVLIRHFAPGRGSPEHLQERKCKYEETDQREESTERDWKAEKHSRRTEEQSVKRHEEEQEEHVKKKEEVAKKEDKKKKEPEETKTIDKKTEVKKVKKKQVTAMDKMRQLFSRSDTKTLKKSKKKEEKKKGDKNKEEVEVEEEEEDPLATRYTEYKGSNVEEARDTSRTSYRGERRLPSDTEEQQDLGRSRERLATPSPSPQHAATLGRREDSKTKDVSWFKSLDRKSSKHAARVENVVEATTEDDTAPGGGSGSKSLRFFGDTDVESVSVARGHAPARRYKSNGNSNTSSSSNRLQVPQQRSGLRNHHRHHRSTGDVGTSSAESTTEGDSSQQSQKSVVYLHAATVGDIPNRNLVARSQRRAQSREELSSVASSHRLQPQTRTVSRSISVLAPWRPRNFKDNMEVHYENELPNRSGGKPPKVPASHQSNGASTMSRTMTRRKTEDSLRANPQKQKVSKAMSVESLSRQESSVGPRSQTATKKRNLSTSIESLSHKNGTAKTPQQSRMAKKNSALNASAMELSNSRSYKSGTAKKIGDNKKNNSAKLARSASMPKDTRASGWFKMKSKKQAT